MRMRPSRALLVLILVCLVGLALPAAGGAAPHAIVPADSAARHRQEAPTPLPSPRIEIRPDLQPTAPPDVPPTPAPEEPPAAPPDVPPTPAPEEPPLPEATPTPGDDPLHIDPLQDGFPAIQCEDFPVQVNTPKFMTLPFPAHPDMEVLQGWHYDFATNNHCGIDFVQRNSGGGGFNVFPVLAVADGEACAENGERHGGGCVTGFGGRVLIRHAVDGATFYTYYGHLIQIDAAIPRGNRSTTIPVKRGQIIGYASDTGTTSGVHHLHFGLATPDFGWLDPYDLWRKHDVYPDPNQRNTLLSGPNHYWMTNPPSTFDGRSFTPVGDDSASNPAQAMVAGVVDLADWASIEGRESGTVEIWINGEKQGETLFGPAPNTAQSTFRWEWDTTSERNGPHLLEVRARTEDGRPASVRFAPDAVPTVATEDDLPSDRMMVSVQNPWGMIVEPAPLTALPGVTPITGWAMVAGSTVQAVEIWIDGQKRGEATYGLYYKEAGGNFGFVWLWDTTREREGEHTIEVRVIAANGGSALLSPARQLRERSLSVLVQNRATVPRWIVR